MVAVLVAFALAGTAWWVLRGAPQEIRAPAAAAPAAARDTDPLIPPAAAESDREITSDVVVDVAGKVRRPGIVVLDPGSRVVDAIEAAGGPRRGVKLTSLNLARLLVDGEQILVGATAAPAAVAPSAGAPSAGAPAGSLVSLNTASTTELETLPQVGPVTAQAIVAWREEHGAFTAVEELLEVDGIGDATLEQITPFVTL